MRTDVPCGWGDDPLSEYFHIAYRNRLATFANKSKDYARLSKIDSCFVKVAGNWLNPPDLLSPLLFLRSHSSYRAACEHALAGQAGDLFAQLRSCLERAGYALLIGKIPDIGEVWLNRHADQTSMAASKKAFTVSAITSCLAQFDMDGAERFQKLYQLTIDFGAHPNERAITGNLTINKNARGKEYLQAYMHGEGIALDHALVSTARVGLCALETAQNLYAARFELLGVKEEILDLRRGL